MFQHYVIPRFYFLKVYDAIKTRISVFICPNLKRSTMRGATLPDKKLPQIHKHQLELKGEVGYLMTLRMHLYLPKIFAQVLLHTFKFKLRTTVVKIHWTCKNGNWVTNEKKRKTRMSREEAIQIFFQGGLLFIYLHARIYKLNLSHGNIMHACVRTVQKMCRNEQTIKERMASGLFTYMCTFFSWMF